MLRDTRLPRRKLSTLGPGAATAVMLALATPSGWVAAQKVAIDTIAGQTVTRGESVAIDPAPPRTLFLGFVETSGRTLPSGQGHVAVGYLGSSILAQRAGFGNVAPFVVHAAYGVTDNVTITAGSGFIGDHGREEAVFIPYIAHRLRLWGSERSSIAFGHFLGVRTPKSSSKRAVLFGASLAASSSVSDRVTVNLSIGAMGFTDEYDPGRYTGLVDVGRIPGTVDVSGERRTEADAVLAIGAEFALGPSARLVGEYRLIEPSDESGLFSAGLRLLGTTLDGEVGLAMWSEDRAAFQPIASIGYRF